MTRSKKIITAPKKKRHNSVFTRQSRKEIAKNRFSPFHNSLPPSFLKKKIVRWLPLRNFFYNVRREEMVLENGQVKAQSTISILEYFRKLFPQATSIHVWRTK